MIVFYSWIQFTILNAYVQGLSSSLQGSILEFFGYTNFQLAHSIVGIFSFIPIILIPFLIFLFVVVIFAWWNHKDKEKAQKKREEELNERIRKLEEKVKEKDGKVSKS